MWRSKARDSWLSDRISRHVRLARLVASCGSSTKRADSSVRRVERYRTSVSPEDRSTETRCSAACSNELRQVWVLATNLFLSACNSDRCLTTARATPFCVALVLLELGAM